MSVNECMSIDVAIIKERFNDLSELISDIPEADKIGVLSLGKQLSENEDNCLCNAGLFVGECVDFVTRLNNNNSLHEYIPRIANAIYGQESSFAKEVISRYANIKKSFF